MFLVLPICVLLISLMQSINGAQFLNTIFLSLSFEFAAGAGAGAIIMIQLTSIFIYITTIR